tara:strand:- start:789 stop:1664 length:876 start_codon:yes stop_codon:yes gene_type:complete
MKKEQPYDEPLRDDQTLVISTSGGKDSTAMLVHFLKEANLPNPLRFVFADTGWEHQDTYAYLDILEKTLNIKIDRVKGPYDFVSLAVKKKSFPSTRRRFCTEELKVKPIAIYMDALIDNGEDPVMVVGIRAAESKSRALMSEWAYSGAYDAPIWRPLLKWTAEDVFDLHKKHDVPPNPLYLKGATRVGCYPCIMARKGELSQAFKESDVMIEKLREAEKKVSEVSKYGVSTMFAHDKCPKRFHDLEYTNDKGVTYTMASVDGIRKWALDGDQPELDFGEPPSCFSQYGLCE